MQSLNPTGLPPHMRRMSATRRSRPSGVEKAEWRDGEMQSLPGGTPRMELQGGDAGAAELQGSPPTQPPLALYSGVVTVGANGTAEVSFDIPDFAGTARVMAVAWSKDKVGRAVGDVIVRDPVVLTTTLPRSMQ